MSDAEVSATVTDVMTRPVTTISADQTVAEAADSLFRDRIGSLLVEAEDEIVGIVTETDVVGLVADGKDPSTSVSEVASTSLITVESSARIEEAAEKMKRHTIKKLPVTDESGEIVGIVTTTDISNYFPSYHPRDQSWA